MTIQNMGICITAVISVVSIIISIANYQKSRPKLKIVIDNKRWDCFFGKTILINNRSFDYICGVKMSIINNSPVAITINNINMTVEGEILRFIDNRNQYWESVMFYFEDDNGELTTDGIDICYKESGFELPFKINAYDVVTVVTLFHNFPAKIRRKCKGRINLYTAIGNKKKKVTMVEYDRNYETEDYRDYIAYCRSKEELQ